MVRDGNARAQHVYAKLGFERFEPSDAERREYSTRTTPVPGAFAMRLER
jgi:hypothetical protein